VQCASIAKATHKDTGPGFGETAQAHQHIMLIEESGEAWPLVHQAIHKFGDNVAIINTRQNGLYIGNVVRMPCFVTSVHINLQGEETEMHMYIQMCKHI